MSKRNSKHNFFANLFRSSKTKEVPEHHRNRNQVKFDSRYDEGRRHNRSFDVDESALRDENGFYKPTAAYHTSTRNKPSRGTRSCYSKIQENVNSSDSDHGPSNHSYHAAFNPADASKRNFRRTSKRHKKTAPLREVDEYDEQSSSAASYVLQTVDMNTHHARPIPKKMNEYWVRPSRHYEDSRPADLFAQKYVDSTEKIQEYVNRYRREKARTISLQRQIEDLSEKRRLDQEMIHQQQVQIQKLQEEIYKIRNPFTQTSLFQLQNQFMRQQHSETPSSHIYPNYHNQTITSMIHEPPSMAPTRTVSDLDTESEIRLKSFRNEHDGAPEKLISESSLPLSINSNKEGLEIGRSNSKEDSFSAITLTQSVISNPIPIVRDEGYATSSSNKNIIRRNKHFSVGVPTKIRRTNSLN